MSKINFGGKALGTDVTDSDSDFYNLAPDLAEQLTMLKR